MAVHNAIFNENECKFCIISQRVTRDKLYMFFSVGMGQVHVTNPRYVLVVSGGCCSPKKKSFVVGGWAFVCPCISNVQKISLELMTLQPYCEDVETALGVPLTVTATAQCKIIKDKELLKIACEQFLGYDINEIEFAVRSTLEGHLRSILGNVQKDTDTILWLLNQ